MFRGSKIRPALLAIGGLVVGLLFGLRTESVRAQESLEAFVPEGYLAAFMLEGRDPSDPSLTENERVTWETLGPFYADLLLAVPVFNWQAMPANLRDGWIEDEVGKSLLSSRLVGYSRMTETPNGMVPSGGLMVSEGAFARWFEQMIRNMAAESGAPLDRLRLNNAKVQRARVDGLALEFGTINGSFVVTLGAEDELAWWMEQEAAPTPEAWTRAMANTNVESRWLAMDFDFATLLAMTNSSSEAQQAFAVSGAASIRSISLQAGFDEEGYVHRLWLDCPEGAAGVLGSFEPAEPGAVMQGLAMDRAASLTTGNDFIARLAMLSDQLSPSDDSPSLLSQLAGALGSGALVQYSPEDGGLLTGFSVVMPVEDRKSAQQLEQEMLEQIQVQIQSGAGNWWGPPKLLSAEYQGSTIYTFIENPFNPLISITWTLTDDYLVLGQTAISIKPTMDRLAQRLEAGSVSPSEPVGLDLRFRLQDLLGSTSGLGQFFTRVMVHEMGWSFRDDGEWNQVSSRMVSSLPDSTRLLPILRSEERITITTQQSGVAIEARVSMPGSELLLLGTVGAGGTVFADQAGVDIAGLIMPSIAGRADRINAMKQIGLAMHNYHDTFNKFPAQAIVDENGTPLLSWRVAILPYIEQSDLYQQFHLDEPWDSEHNLALLEKMPVIYRTTASSEQPFHTNFQVLSTEDGIFSPGGEGARIASITDGTSNTFMVVEAPNEQAIEWTRPDDITPDMDLWTQFFGSRDSFIVVTADGAVHTVSSDTTSEELQAFISKAGGEIVNWRE